MSLAAGRRFAHALLASSVALAYTARVLSQTPPADPASPVIVFDEMTHDFGRIPSNAKVTYAWAFRNAGKSGLRIVSTRPSCGCTASVIDDRDVEAGKHGTLTVTFDPAGQHGHVRKSLAVQSNDPATPLLRLTILADVVSVDLPQAPGGHPPIAGQSMLMGSCASCHGAPASGKSSEALWTAVCAMCHGASGEGGKAPSLREADYLASHADAALAQAIAYGTSNPKMPGFSADMGGPLDAAQIDSLVKLLRRWGPATARPTAPAPAKAP